MSDVKFSIVTGTIGRSTLKDLHQSLLNQYYKNWEWVVVFDGERSFNKNAQNFFEDSVIFNDNRIKYYIISTTEVGGFGREQRIFGAKNITSNWLIYVDDDDILYSHALSSILNYISYHDLITFRTYCDFLGRSIPTHLHWPKIGCGEIASCSYAIRKDLLIKANYYPITNKRLWNPGLPVDTYYFNLLKKLAVNKVIMADVLALARHNYKERGCEPSWVQRFGH